MDIEGRMRTSLNEMYRCKLCLEETHGRAVELELVLLYTLP